MKKAGVSVAALGLAVASLVASSGGCGRTYEPGKIPLTTSSREARQQFRRGLDRLDNLEVTNARAAFEKAVAADPNFALAHLGLALTQPSPEAFLREVSRAKALGGKVSKGERLWILAIDASTRGDVQKSSELYHQLAEAYPGDERSHFLLGNNYLEQQKLKEAIAAYRKAIEINREFAAPYNTLGYALRFSGDNREAEKVFKKYAELVPDRPNPHDSYGELLLALGQHEESIAAYRKALAVDPHFTPSYLGLATNLNLLGKHEEARALLAEMYQQARDDGERRQALFATVVSYVDQGKLEPAVEEMHKVYAIAEQNGNSIQMGQDLNTIGFLLLEAGKIPPAQAAFEKSVQVRRAADIPEFAKAQAERELLVYGTRVAVEQGDLQTAREKADRFRELAQATGNPNQVRLYHELAGLIALQEKDYERAIQELDLGNQQSPYNVYRMALAYRGQGDKEKAKNILTELLQRNDLNSLSYGLVRQKARRLAESL